MRKYLRAARDWMAQNSPATMYCSFINAVRIVTRHPCRMNPTDQGRFKVTDRQSQIYIAHGNRYCRYKVGITRRTQILASHYLLDQLDLTPGGVFIDCGANIGELGIWARSQQLNYHAFEPEKLEASCCDLNNFAGERKTNQIGLWNETGELKFYSKPDSADSSLIEFSGYCDVKSIPVITLDDYVRQQGIEAIEVFKVEAEGAEPEVLQGAWETLAKCRYVTVDCGPERGLNSENTVRDVCNTLFEMGFRIQLSGTDRLVLLFARPTASGLLAA